MTTNPQQPACSFAEGCHRVLACEPGCAVTTAVSVPASAPTDRAAKAESLLLRFAAEAHRRKWAYDRGLDDDGVPRKSEAFDALHRLGEEMRTALDELRRERAAAVSGSGRVADETQAERRCRLCDEPITGPGVTYFGAPDGPHFHVDREECRIAGGLPPKPAVVSQPDGEA